VPDRVKPDVLVVTGMSGAGRSTAAKVLEDLGYTVIDNLPPTLIGAVANHHGVPEHRRRLVAVVDARGGFPSEDLRRSLVELERAGIRTLMVFLDAEDAALIRRYEENRRPHPVPAGSLAEAITNERALLDEVRDLADVVIDTTELNVHQLRDRITEQFSEGPLDRPMRVAVTSFGFKHGVPRDADLVFDVRFLPNPHWVPELRGLRGTDREVADYVFGNPDADDFVARTEDMLEFLLPRFRSEGKSYLTIAIGCTGGHHRSVAIAERLGGWLEEREVSVSVRHRDVAR
jgi:RNase adapter protein RapZ